MDILMPFDVAAAVLILGIEEIDNFSLCVCEHGDDEHCDEYKFEF